MPSALFFEKGVLGSVPSSHLAMNGLTHKINGIYKLTSLLKGLISCGSPF